MVEDTLQNPGLLAVCIREVQHTLQQSAKRLIETKLQKFGLGEADGYRIYTDRIQTRGDGLIIFQGMQDHTAESIKSLEGYLRAYVEEAQTLSQHSLRLLRPTIREEGSEIWFGWNPTRKSDPVDVLFRGKNDKGVPHCPTGSVVVETSWRTNPWWNKVLEQERLDTLYKQPDQYGHIWEGEYQLIAEGAYYAQSLAELKAQRRLGRITADPLMAYRAFWDIGGTGAKADHTVIWVAQFVDREIRVLDYYEAQGQPLASHVAWLRREGYGDAICILPHDGATHDKVYAVSYESFLRQAGFEARVIPNQGRGAAFARIEAARRMFPRCWVNETTCKQGIETLGLYRPRIDPKRNLDLGPEHDEASHCADAFGLMCVTYEEPYVKAKKRHEQHDGTSWLSL